MSATILQFRPRPGGRTSDAYRIAVGRALARGEGDVTDDEARALALEFEALLVEQRAATVDLTPAERRERLAGALEAAIATAAPAT